jgi:HEAT repeat protein
MHEPHLLAGWILSLALLSSAAPAQDQGATPQAVLEHAHYVEAHEHDLAAAKAGYAQALEAARRLGQVDVAAQAERALERVRVRLGELPAPAQEALPADLVDLFAMASTAALDDGRAANLTRDLLLYGDRATLVLAEWIALPRGSLSATVSTPQRGIMANPYFAARALGALGTPMARAALLGALDSEDPLLRREVIDHARSDHGALFAKAIDEPIDALRQLATVRLLDSDDPSGGAALLTLVRRGVSGAAGRLARFAPLLALEVASDPSLTPQAIEELDNHLRIRNWMDLGPEHVERFFAAASSGADERQRRVAENALSTMVQTRNLDLAPDRAALLAAFERALAQAAPDLQVRHGWVLGPERALALLESYLAARPDVLSESEDELVEGLARYCIERSGDPAAVATRLFVPILARSEIARVANSRPGSAYPNECAATVAFGYAIAGPADADARFLTMFKAIPESARPAFQQHVYNWVSSRLRADPTLIEPGTLAPQFVDVAVSMLQAESFSSARYSALAVARAIGTSTAVEALILNTRFPESCPGQVVKVLAEGLDESSARQVAATLVEAIGRFAGDPVQQRRLAELVRFGFDLRGVPLRDYLLAVWAHPLSDELRNQVYHEMADWLTGDDVLPLLFELYPTLPDSAKASRARAVKRFGDNLYEPAIDLLGEALRDRELEVRNAAQEAFQRFRAHREALEEYEAWRQASDEARETVAQLVALLASDDRDVVRGAVEALGAVKARTALPQLVALLGRDDAELKAAVTKAIAAIGG